MGMRKVAVVGAGMTKFVRRAQETPKELAWESTRMALESCELTMDDVDGVCLGTAPDSFDGVHLKGEYLSDGSGAWGKPYMRSYVGGGTGVFAPIQGWYHIASGMFDLVLVVAEEKMSSFYPHAQAAFLTIFDHTTERALMPNLLWIFALEMHRYMHVHGIKKEQIALVSVKNKGNALDHPCAQLPAKILCILEDKKHLCRLVQQLQQSLYIFRKMIGGDVIISIYHVNELSRIPEKSLGNNTGRISITLS